MADLPIAKRGRKHSTHLRQATLQIIAESSPHAAGYLRDVQSGKEKPDTVRVDVSKYIVNQDIGAPRQRTELTGASSGPLIIRVLYDGQLAPPEEETLQLPSPSSN